MPAGALFQKGRQSYELRAACPQLPEVKPLQAEAKIDGQNGKASQTKEINTPNGGVIKAPNEGNKTSTISFMSLKSTPVANQEPFLEGGTGLQPGLMTSTLKQDNQAAKSRFLTNERTPRLSAILPPLDPSTQFPQPWSSQCPDEPLIENVKFGGGTI
ncbi:hypothetical protein DSO57_1023516 [Entomophthora muscae]|uniref:Uncharacterized protein n=1 Tax=Entomophthora muscae TaxID=34485 RepID=A0ACC2UCB2_9FUNG|nr:hypothetical protein DSO57_1023516 [Entomophthora muscae]